MKFYDADIDGTIPHPLWKTKVIFRTPMTGERIQAYADALEESEQAVAVLLHNNNDSDDGLWERPPLTSEADAAAEIALGGDWTLSFTSFGKPAEAAIMAALTEAGDDVTGIEPEKLPETDWLQHVHQHFPPVTLGRFFIYGSHYDGDLPADKIALRIDAATAFGSGEHETTKGCLMALEEMVAQGKTFKNILDMGCGSGILAIAAKTLWPSAKLTCIDIDPESVIVTKRHAQLNGTADLTAEAGNGYHSPIVAKNGPYDLILCNILAGPLIDMAPDLAKNLENGGSAVLSGLLVRQEEQVTKAHQDCGLTLTDSKHVGDWRALVFEKG